jgi:hypothetical protein
MPHPLDGPWQKIKWAEDRLNSLYIQANAYMELRPVTSLSVIDPRSGKQLAIYALYPPVPPSLAMLVGEVVHGLRSTLDHLVGQLIIQNCEVPDDKTAYPIFKDARFLEDKAAFFERTNRAIGKCSASVKDVIEGSQPYHQRHLAYRDPLWLIHELDIIDKHRTISVVGGNYRAKWKKGGKIIVGGIEMEVDSAEEQGAFHEYVVIGEIGPDGELKSKFEPGIQITLGFGQHEGLSAGERAGISGMELDTIIRMYEYVADALLPRFAGFFPQPFNPLDIREPGVLLP